MENEDKLADKAKEVLQELWSEMLAELDFLGKQGYFTPSLLVSKVRDYNRKWNKRADRLKFLQIDGFKKFAKRTLIDNSKFGNDFITALKYL